MKSPVRSAVSVALYLFQRLSILVIALFALALAAYAVACVLGAAAWLQLPLSVGGQVDCTMATSRPRTVSSILTWNSPSLNRVVFTGTNSAPYAAAIRAPNSWDADPARMRRLSFTAKCMVPVRFSGGQRYKRQAKPRQGLILNSLAA